MAEKRTIYHDVVNAEQALSRLQAQNTRLLEIARAARPVADWAFISSFSLKRAIEPISPELMPAIQRLINALGDFDPDAQPEGVAQQRDSALEVIRSVSSMLHDLEPLLPRMLRVEVQRMQTRIEDVLPGASYAR